MTTWSLIDFRSQKNAKTQLICKLLFKGRKMSIVYNCLYAFLRTNFSPDMQHSLMALNLMGPNTLYAFIMSFNANRNCRLRNYVSSECYCIRIQNTLSINTTKRTINIFCLQKATKNYITALIFSFYLVKFTLNLYFLDK